jgi:Leucine-rich repeat (LRR) protein
VPDFSQLPYLHFLSVRNNNFQGVAKLPDKLHAARFHGNAVTVIDLPKDLEQLKHITYLEFSHNQLTGNVPEIIARLPTLAVLQLNNNHLTSLPQSWVGMQDGQGTIARLHHLDVSHNKLAVRSTGQGRVIGFR